MAPLPHAQAATWAWAGIPLARLGSIRPGATLAVNLNPTVEHHFREAKTPTPAAPLQTLGHDSVLFLLSLSGAVSSDGHPRRLEKKRWRCRRGAPRRRARSPDAEDAAVEGPCDGAHDPEP